MKNDDLFFSLRAMFADDLPINPIHGSDSEETAEQELRYFFPMEQTVAVIKPDAIGTKGTAGWQRSYKE